MEPSPSAIAELCARLHLHMDRQDAALDATEAHLQRLQQRLEEHTGVLEHIAEALQELLRRTPRY